MKELSQSSDLANFAPYQTPSLKVFNKFFDAVVDGHEVVAAREKPFDTPPPEIHDV